MATPPSLAFADSPSLQVFVYGTLKPGERAYGHLCAPHVTGVTAAIAAGRIYHLPQGYPAMTLESGWVQGYCLTFPAEAQQLRALDAFEDHIPGQPQASLYQRQWRPVHSPDGQDLNSAWVYTMPLETVVRLGGTWLASGSWSGAFPQPDP